MSEWCLFIIIGIMLGVSYIGLLISGLILTGVDISKKSRELCKYCSCYHGGCMAPFDEAIGCPYNHEKDIRRR